MPDKKLAMPGSISWGTLKTEDLIDVFFTELEMLDPERYREVWEEYEGMLSMFLNETLWDVMEEYAPEDCYFGANEGDGADFGYWPIME